MKKLSLVIAALALVLGITQCKKQEDPVGGKLITQKVTFTTSFGDDSKLGVDEEGGTLDLSWQVGDIITVSDGQTEPSSTLECTSVSEGGKTGTFEGTITCIEDAQLTFSVGTKPDYMNQHFTAINESEIYLVGESDFEQSGNYEVDMALPYAILKVDLAEFATPEGTNVSVTINDETVPAAVVTGVKTDDCQVYLLLLLAVTDPTETILTFTNEDETVTVKKSYPLASHGFYTGGGNGGFAPVVEDNRNYLCFTAVEAPATVSLTIKGTLTTNPVLETSTDGSTWSDYTLGVEIKLKNMGDKVYFRSKTKVDKFSVGSSNYAYFVMTGKIAASGNIMSLIDPSCEETAIPECCFYYLFSGCTSLTTAPELPATTLASGCYYKMFNGCTSLTAAPALPATALAGGCYGEMFSGCTNLTAAPELPAETLASSCYYKMFNGCKSLTAAPALPATTLTISCYSNMFNGCTSLTAAPELPATTLATSCYYYMFNGCTSLTAAPELPATTLATNCYYSMFYGCTSLTTAPELPATTLATSCYSYMFQRCSSLNYIKVHFTTWSSSTSWVSGVSSTGKFYCPSGLPHEVSDHGDSKIPTGWSVEPF